VGVSLLTVTEALADEFPRLLMLAGGLIVAEWVMVVPAADAAAVPVIVKVAEAFLGRLMLPAMLLPLPLVLLSSLGQREVTSEKNLFNAALTKPVKPSQLFDTLAGLFAEQPTAEKRAAPAKLLMDPEMAKKHSLRILLAEDNPVNQMVARRFLEKLGHRVTTVATGAAAVAAIAMVTAVGRGRHMLGRSRRWLIAVTVLAPVALLAWKIGWSAIFGNLVESPRLGYRCLLMSMAMGGVPLASLVMTRKGDDPRHPSLLGAAMGVAVGACGWVLIDLWCPVAGPIHLLRGHVLPVVLLGLLGAAVGKVALAVHAKH